MPLSSGFLDTDDFSRLLVQFVPLDALTTLRYVCKEYTIVVNEFIRSLIKRGTMIAHDGRDTEFVVQSQEWRRKLAKQVLFLQNITQIGDRAFKYARNLTTVEIPEGVTSIGRAAFFGCSSLTKVTFPTTLTSISFGAFAECSSLQNVDLLHTNLQKIDGYAFGGCSELKSVKLPTPLEAFGDCIFHKFMKLALTSFVTKITLGLK